MDDRQLARGLGWFSIGLGLLELTAPKKLGETLGLTGREGWLRAFGVREILNGCAILAAPKPADWLLARVAGDALDLGLLGTALSKDNPQRGNAAGALATVAGITALDLLCAQRLARQDGTGGLLESASTQRSSTSITIDRPAPDLYDFWRNADRLPRIMRNLESVRRLDDRRSHWTVTAPTGTTLEWVAEIVADRPNEYIAWQSLEGGDVDTRGTVRFERAPGGRGTVVQVEMEYRPPAGAIGATLAKLFGQSPEKRMDVDLHRFKQLMETGEIARTEGQPAGRHGSTSKLYDEWVRG